MQQAHGTAPRTLGNPEQQPPPPHRRHRRRCILSLRHPRRRRCLSPRKHRSQPQSLCVGAESRSGAWLASTRAKGSRQEEQVGLVDQGELR